MTRFARSKGSKASNERVPEQSTSWGELKEQLLEKNKEKDNKVAQEKAFQQRTANYKAFLKEREEEEAKNVSWAEFPGANINGLSDNQGKKRKNSIIDSEITINKKRVKQSNQQDQGTLKQAINKKELNNNQGNNDTSTVKNKKGKKNNPKSAKNSSSPDFDDLKCKIDKILDKSDFGNNNDTDVPPEEASSKNKPKEIVIKKSKIKKPLLKIVQNRQQRHDNSSQNENKFDTNLTNKQAEKQKEVKNKKKKDKIKKTNDEQNDKKQETTVQKEDLSEESLLKIEKKQERYKKQLEKKKQKRKEKKLKNRLEKNGAENNVSTEKEIKKKQLIPEYNNENLTEKELLKIQKKKERRARQAEKRKKLQESKKHKNPEENGESGKEIVKKDKNKNVLGEEVKEKNLSPKELAKVNKKKEKLARQAENRKKFREENQQRRQQEIDSNRKDLTADQTEKVENAKVESGNGNLQNEKPSERTLAKKEFNLNNKVTFKTDPTKKKFKNKDDKDHKRKKPLPKPEKMFINGKQVEIDYVDGFPVKKEDADRLRQLRKDMVNKGLPRSEIDVALKLERRRAEKALAREKKNVCFNCRKSGHNLSDCPELGNNQLVQSSGTGICFKCGSTEHTHFECKVEKGDVYKFASCFICNEQGHIAKQCPDNQRGLYPKGGSCKVCGDVTHLKKDCPKYQAQQQHLQSSLSIGTLDSSNPDMMDGSSSGKGNGNKSNLGGKGMSKVVKF